MQHPEDRSELYDRAKKRVAEIKGFYIHLGVYLIVNAGLFAINMITNPDNLWFYWPLLGWGVGVAIHAFAFIIEGRWLGAEWEQRKIEQLVLREEYHPRKRA